MCKSCTKEYMEAWSERNPGVKEFHFRNSRLRREFGITVKEYDEMLEQQNSKCALCDKDREDEDRNFAVDHNHSTGEIRGLLCRDCNYRLVGKFEDSNFLRKMADYLDKGTGRYVPKKS